MAGTATKGKLTARQREVFAFIVEHAREHGLPPTTREISQRFGKSSQTSAQHILRPLERKGWIEREVRNRRYVVVGKPCECCGGLGRILDTEAEA